MKRNAFIAARLGLVLLSTLVLSLSHLRITTAQSPDQAEDPGKVHHTVFQVLPPPKHLVDELNQTKRDLEQRVESHNARIPTPVYDQSEDNSKVHHTVFQAWLSPKHLVDELNRMRKDLEYQAQNDAQTPISESIYETTVFSLTVHPGETETIVLPVRDQPASLSEARYVIITTRSASVEHRHAVDTTVLAASSFTCVGAVGDPTHVRFFTY